MPITGVGSVAVSPEHRRRGVGEACMRAALRELRHRGSALSALYAFRGSYYRKLGYGAIEVVHQIATAAANLPPSDEARRVRRLMLPDRPLVQALYDRVAPLGHFALERPSAWWSQRLWGYPGDWVVYEGKRRGQIEGYLYYDVENSRGPFRLALTVAEVVAATPQAHRGLVGHLATLADQVEEIHYAAPADDAWISLLRTSQNLRPGAEIGPFHDTGGVAHGAMLRITDVKAALESLPVAPNARGDITLEVEDSVLPQNARAYRLSARDGRMRVTADAGRRGAAAAGAGRRAGPDRRRHAVAGARGRDRHGRRRRRRRRDRRRLVPRAPAVPLPVQRRSDRPPKSAGPFTLPRSARASATPTRWATSTTPSTSAISRSGARPIGPSSTASRITVACRSRWRGSNATSAARRW